MKCPESADRKLLKVKTGCYGQTYMQLYQQFVKFCYFNVAKR